MVYTDGIHLLAESVPELHTFAESIGLNKCWFHRGARKPHYDLVNKKRVPLKDKSGVSFAIKAEHFGALNVTSRQLVKLYRINYCFPQTEEEVYAYEKKFAWRLSQPISEKDKKMMEQSRVAVFNKIWGTNCGGENCTIENCVVCSYKQPDL